MSALKNSIDNIKVGDFLVWRKSQDDKLIDKIANFFIRLFTLSSFYHTGLVYEIDKDNNEVYIIEASNPKVRIRKLSDSLPCFIIHVDIENRDLLKKYLEDQLGEKYNLLGVVTAWCGKFMKGDNRWICTKLVSYAYEKFLNINLHHYTTPDKLTIGLMKELNKPLRYLD